MTQKPERSITTRQELLELGQMDHLQDFHMGLELGIAHLVRDTFRKEERSDGWSMEAFVLRTTAIALASLADLPPEPHLQWVMQFFARNDVLMLVRQAADTVARLESNNGNG
jgi:hypothetical protein